MSLRLAPEGRRAIGQPLAIVDSSNPAQNGLLLSVLGHDDTAPGSAPRIRLQPGSHFQLLPNLDPAKRDAIAVLGPSGCGKSTVAGTFLRKYCSLYPSRQCYLICGASGEKDPAFADLFAAGKLQQIPIAELAEINLEEAFPDACCIVVDDIESSSRKELEMVERLTKGVLCLGRKPCWSVLVLGHTLCDGNRTKYLLNESNTIVLFPRQTMAGQLSYLCEKKLGMNQEQVKELKRLPSRWACIWKNNVPSPLLISETEAYML
jgi:hypothetical protein